MRIAIHCAELNASRIDGTRVYLLEVLRRLGKISPETEFHLFHQGGFHPDLVPPQYPNYTEHIFPKGRHWTQTKFFPAVKKLNPDVVWMPIQMIPLGIPKSIRVVVTVHDLAFEKYPTTFPWRDRYRHKVFLRYALRRADHIIAVSESTKRDILRLMPKRNPDSISVIHHGFDDKRFTPTGDIDSDARVLARHGVTPRSYVLYVGALQPRKNIVRLLDAFAMAKQSAPDMRLVLVGSRAWLWKSIEKTIQQHPFREDIYVTGEVSAEDLPSWYRNARVFAYPSLYEGFGMPILEAFASGVPVLTANNSSLSEVGGEAPRYAEATDASEIARQLITLWSDEAVRRRCIERGLFRVREFSWDTTATRTIETLFSAIK